MPNISISVAGKRATVEGAPVIICGNSDYTLQLTLDDEWSAATYKTARFVYVRDGQVLHEDRDFTGTTVEVPPLANVRQVKVGIFAGELYTSTPAVIPCKLSILCESGEPANPTPEEDARIMELLNKAIKVEADVQEAKTAAETAATKAQASETATRDLMGQVEAIVAGNEAYTKYESDQKYAASIIGSASGEMVSVQDGAEREVVNLEAFGKSEQDSTTGVQLINWANGLVSSGGLTPTVLEDGGIRVTGTPIVQYAQVLSRQTSLPSGTYYISGGTMEAGCVIAQVTIENADGTRTHYVNKTFNVLDGDTVYIMIQSGGSLDAVDYVIYPMLNAGSTALPWEPYTGGKPSPNPDYPQKIRSTVISEIKTVGKNWLNLTNGVDYSEQGIVVTNNKNGSYLVSGTSTTTWLKSIISVELKAGITFVLNGGVSDKVQLSLRNSNGATIYLGDLENSANSEYTPSEDMTAYLYVRVGNGITVNETIYPMLRVKGTDPTYEPYTETVATLSEPITLYGITTTSGGNFTDSNNQQWIADYIDTAKGKVVRNVVKLNVYDETVYDWGAESYGHDFYILREQYDTTNYIARTIPAICNKLAYTEERIAPSFYYRTHNMGWDGYARIGFRVPSDVNTVDLFKEYLGEDCEFILPLKDPTVEDLSTNDIVALKNLKTFYGITHVMNDSEVKGEMVVGYHVDTKTYIDNKFKELAAVILASE